MTQVAAAQKLLNCSGDYCIFEGITSTADTLASGDLITLAGHFNHVSGAFYNMDGVTYVIDVTGNRNVIHDVSLSTITNTAILFDAGATSNKLWNANFATCGTNITDNGTTTFYRYAVVAASTGDGTVKMGSANPANSAGWIRLYNENTQTFVWVPYWTDATP